MRFATAKALSLGVTGFVVLGCAAHVADVAVVESKALVSTPAATTAASQALAAPRVAARGQVVGGRECLTVISGLGPGTASKVGPRVRQAVVASGRSMRSSYSTLSFWRKIGTCWVRDFSRPGRNGATGWHPHPWDGSGYSPIGVYRLTDAGGRLANPGTRLPYSHGPKWWDQGGFKMNSDAIQVFNYVVAINFNRYAGRSPRDLARPNPRIPDGGIWFHVSGAGATRGCLSLPQPEMIKAMRWFDPSLRPTMIMGPASSLVK